MVKNVSRHLEFYAKNANLLPPPECLELELDLPALIETIRVHPDADLGYISVVESLVNRYAPELLGRVQRSEIAKPPVF